MGLARILRAEFVNSGCPLPASGTWLVRLRVCLGISKGILRLQGFVLRFGRFGKLGFWSLFV